MQKKILSILIVGLILASSAMPNLFFKWFDPIVYLMVDGSWIAADIVQYLLAAVFILMISHLLLHWKKWPWDVLILWIPYLFWCLLSYFWSIYPSYSVHESIHDVFIAQVVFIFAYALAVSRVLDFKTLFSIFFYRIDELCLGRNLAAV